VNRRLGMIAIHVAAAIAGVVVGIQLFQVVTG